MNKIKKFFKLEEHGTNVKTEILAGITTFLTMAYILVVNPAMLSETGMPAQSVFLATALSAAFATLMMGIVANFPVGLAPGLGLNAFFTYNLVIIGGYSWEAALAAVFVSGILFLIVSATGLRKKFIEAIPKNLKIAISLGIGGFITFIGLQNAGIIVANEATLVGIGNLTSPPVVLAIVGIFITFVLFSRKVNAAVFYGLISTAVIGVIAGLFGVAGMPQLPTAIASVNFDFTVFGGFIRGFGELFTKPDILVVLFTLVFLDLADTTGTLLAVAGIAGLTDEDGEVENIEKALIVDSVGTVVGSMMGTSTVTSFLESCSGTVSGGRTGLTAVSTAFMFLLSVFFFPLLSVITPSVTSAALISVGVLMFQQAADIEWSDFSVAASSFITIIVMITSYSIAEGIAAGFIVHGVTKAFSGKHKDVDLTTWILIAIFVLYFIL